MSNTNWSKWSAIAEIISSIAILVTLIFLVVETSQNSDLLEQNTEAILANTNDTIINTDLLVLDSIITQPEISLSMYKPNLTELEKSKLLNWLIALLRTREHQWFQYKNGVLDQKTWESYLTGLRYNFSYPRTRHIWDVLYSTNTFDDEFSQVVNNYLSGFPLRDEPNHNMFFID